MSWARRVAPLALCLVGVGAGAHPHPERVGAPQVRPWPARVVAAPAPLEDEHPDEPRRVEDHPTVLRRAGRPAAARMDRAPRPAGAPGALRTFHGLLHAHTFYSDGSGTPAEAFAAARAEGLDFLAVTPHNHAQAEDGASGERRDGVLIAKQPELYTGAGDVTFTRSWREADGSQHSETLTSPSVLAAAAAAGQADFVAISGQEFSSISKGNHVNVLGVDEVLTVPNGAFKTLYESLAAGGARPVVQMNHPGVHEDLFYRGGDQGTIQKMFNDYGFDDYGESFAALVAGAGPLVTLLEVLSGPALDPEIHERFHYRSTHERDYYYYLVQGFHVSPSVGQDNHFRTWGASTPARMGVLAPELSREAILEAMRQNRTFASEDPDLSLELTGNGAPLGSVLALAADAPLDLTVRVADPSDPASSYVIELFYGDVAPQTRATLEEWVPADGLVDSIHAPAEGEVLFDEFAASGRPEFFYVRVQQSDGDRAWSAPIWINHPRP